MINKQIALPEIYDIQINRQGLGNSASVTLTAPPTILDLYKPNVEHILDMICEFLREIHPFDSVLLTELYRRDGVLYVFPLKHNRSDSFPETHYTFNVEFPGSTNMGIEYDKVLKESQYISAKHVPDTINYFCETYDISEERVRKVFGSNEAFEEFKNIAPESTIIPLVEGICSNTRLYFSSLGKVYMLVLSNTEKNKMLPLITNKQYKDLYTLIAFLKNALASQVVIERLDEALAIYKNKELDNAERLANMMTNLSTIRDLETGQHLERTKKKSLVVLDALIANDFEGIFIDKKEKEYLTRVGVRVASICFEMHDIGKVAISDDILKKPDSLTADEFTQMKLHTVLGGRSLHEFIKKHEKEDDFDHAFFELVYRVIMEHHERYDGLGYPNNLAGKAISLVGRIAKTVDVHDAMANRRYYKDIVSAEVIRETFLAGQGTEFDPDLIDLVLNANSGILEQFEKIDAEHLDKE